MFFNINLLFSLLFVIIFKIISCHKIATTITLSGQSTSGPSNGIGTNARFNGPSGVSILTSSESSESNELYSIIADQSNHMLRKIILSTKVVTSFVGNSVAGSNNGIGTNARFNNPVGIQISPDNKFILVTELTNHLIRSVDLSTNKVSTIAGRAGKRGNTNGIGSNALFDVPFDISISNNYDNNNNSFALIADQKNSMIRYINLTTFKVTLFAGNTAFGNTNGIGTESKFASPSGIDISFDDSYALVADRDNHLIRKIILSTSEVFNIAGRNKGSTDGIGTYASFNYPVGVSISPTGIYALITDTNNHVIRRIILSTLAVDRIGGRYTIYGTTDGVGTNSLYNLPSGISISSTDDFALVSDTGNHLIRYIDLQDPPTPSPTISSMPTVTFQPTATVTVPDISSKIHSIPHPGKWSCSDGDKCVNLHECTNDEAAYRTGNFCHEWPWYNGGYPLGFLRETESSIKTLECFEGRLTNCNKWDTTKIGSDYSSYTLCECQQFDSNPQHDVCLKWACNGYSVQVGCDVGKYDCGDLIQLSDDISYYSSCCWPLYEGANDDDNSVIYVEEENIGEEDVGQDYKVERYVGEASESKSVWWKRLDCESGQIELNPGGAHTDIYYMKNWQCISTLNDYKSYQIYTCQTRDYEGYCAEYTSTTDSSTQFQNSVCTCASYGSNDPGYYYCSLYECEDGGYYKHAPDLGFIGLGVTVGAFGPIAIFFLIFTDCGGCNCGQVGQFIFIFFALVFHAGIQVVTTLGGGIAALLISEAVIVGIFVPAVLIMSCMRRNKKTPPAEDIQMTGYVSKDENNGFNAFSNQNPIVPVLSQPNSSSFLITAVQISVAGDINGGGTGREFAENLIKVGADDWNKWLHPNTNSSWIQYVFDKPYPLSCYGIFSANDAEERDPDIYEIRGYDVATREWTLIHSVTKCPFNSRYQWKWFDISSITHGKYYNSIRMDIKSARNPQHGMIQLGHFHVHAVNLAISNTPVVVEVIPQNITNISVSNQNSIPYAAVAVENPGFSSQPTNNGYHVIVSKYEEVDGPTNI